MFLSRYFLAKFKERYEKYGKRSAVINVSSINALKPSPLTSVYGATKAFNLNFSLGMDKEYSEYVDTLAVLPHSTKTSMNSGIYVNTISAG